MDQCLAINQSLRQIKAHANWIKTRNLSNQATSATRTAHTTPVQQSATSATPTAQPPINPTAGRATTPAAPPVHARPMYKSPRIQALSDQGACFSCSQKDHVAKNCPIATKINEISGA